MDLKNNRVRQTRKKHRLSQTELGEIAGVDQSDISKIERGELEGLTLIKAARIAVALGNSVEYLWPGLFR